MTSDPIYETTSNICGTLKDLGVPASTLRLWHLSESQLAGACHRAAERLAVEVEWSVAAPEAVTPNTISTARPDFREKHRSGDDAIV